MREMLNVEFAQANLVFLRELPEALNRAYELKLDGYRALAIKTDGHVHLRSRNNKDFNPRYPAR